jgi:hypothetical protein
MAVACDVADPAAVDDAAARIGAAQQTGQPVDPATWQDNLDGPVDADRDLGGARGVRRPAAGRSPALWAATHKVDLGRPTP